MTPSAGRVTRELPPHISTPPASPLSLSTPRQGSLANAHQLALLPQSTHMSTGKHIERIWRR